MSTPGTQYALFESVEAIPVEQQKPIPTPPAERRYSDYVVYVDESGDHSLASIDPDYPVFVLALCVFHKRHYAEKIIPAVTAPANFIPMDSEKPLPVIGLRRAAHVHGLLWHSRIKRCIMSIHESVQALL